MDDISIYNQTEEIYTINIWQIQEAGLKLKMSKCEFFKSQIEYLGHLVSGQGLSPMKQKVQAIMDVVPETNINEACHMISLISYYRKFFPVFSDMVWLCSELTQKVPFKWTKQCPKSLDYVTSSPILVYPDSDKQYYLFTSSSKHYGVGVLLQYQEQVKEDGTIANVPHPITYQSCTFQCLQKIGVHWQKKPMSFISLFTKWYYI